MSNEQQTFPLTIKRLGINGEGVGFFKRKVVFVPGALPGEEITAVATKVSKNFIVGKIKKIRKKSPFRIEPLCPVYEACGGCQLQHLRYDQQLKEKRDIVIQALERYTNLEINKLEIKETIGMDNPWNYRNKSQFQVKQQDGKILAGLYGSNSHQLVPIEHCAVQYNMTNRATRTVRKILQELQIPIFNERKKKGIVRTIVTRVGIETKELQIVLITSTKKLPNKEALIENIKKQLPEVKSIMQNINGEKTSLVFGEETMPLAGQAYIEDTLGDFSFELSARTFFQLNPSQTVHLYNEVKKAAALTGKEKVVDAYCGVGTIGLWLADQAGEIRGMDIIPESIADAKKNAARHGITHAKYGTGKAEELLPKWVKQGWKPDIIIVDPPRTGLDQQLLRTILKVRPEKIIYVSCNPSTLAKDINVLSASFQVQYIQPVDMFPQTGHVECVVLLTLKK
ncbi:23S rRNA (uracil(1939)-C(5))-methyltransferase RlmD [Bacillaceae bacterium Marseille-Q3522]|nr:23S rRNA (uracil(1939)-C(5))-methyltransferase RlmD [Bacillaceae bacterium Marseille-Q3522]